MVGDGQTILLADDEPAIRDLYEHWLRPEHEVRTAADGRETLDHLSHDVDVALLDREMPGLSGTEVAELIETSQYELDVVIVSSKPADFDLVELPVDDYLRKPVEESDLRSVVQTCQTQREYRAALDEFFALTAKLAAIEADLSQTELAQSDRYARVRRKVERKRAEVDDALDRSTADWHTAFRTLPDRAESSATEGPV